MTTNRLTTALAALALALPGVGRAQVKIGFINTITGAEAPIGENLTNGVDLAARGPREEGRQGQAREAGRHRQARQGDQRHGAARHRRRGRRARRPVHLRERERRRQARRAVRGPPGHPGRRQGGDHQAGLQVGLPAERAPPTSTPSRSSTRRSRSASRRASPSSTSRPTSATPSPTAGKDYAKQKGLTDRRRRGLPEGRAGLPLHPHQDEGGEPRPRLHGLLRRRRHPAHAAVARGRASSPRRSSAAAPASTPPSSRARRTSPPTSSRSRSGRPSPRKAATEFADRYRAKYGKKPTYHAACAYAAMMIVGEVAAKAGGDREKIREALDTGKLDRDHGRREVPGLRRLHQPEPARHAGRSSTRAASR